MTATRSGRRQPWWPWLAMALVLAVSLSVGATRARGPETTQDRVNNLAKTIKCPICVGESVADSNAAISKEIRRDVAQRISAGQSDAAIRTAYVGIYGEDILLTPDSSGVTGLVWAIPAVVAVLAGAGLIVAFARTRREPMAPPNEEDRALVEAAVAAIEVAGPPP